MQRLREDARLGQQEAATLLGISIQSLINYEDGRERAPAIVLLEFARNVGCQLTDLFYGIPVSEEEDFPGSRPSRSPVPQPAIEQPQPIGGRTPSETSAPPGAQAALNHVNDDALRVAEIMRAFGNLTNPVRQRLLGLLQAIYRTPGSRP